MQWLHLFEVAMRHIENISVHIVVTACKILHVDLQTDQTWADVMRRVSERN